MPLLSFGNFRSQNQGLSFDNDIHNHFGIYHACLVEILSIDASDVPVEYVQLGHCGSTFMPEEGELM